MTAENKLEAMNEMGSKAMENLNKLAELNMKTMEKITSRQMETMKFMMEQSKQQMKMATESKGLDDFIKKQAELAKETGDRLVEESKTGMQMITDVREDYSSFIKEEVDKLSEKFRKVTPGM